MPDIPENMTPLFLGFLFGAILQSARLNRFDTISGMAILGYCPGTVVISAGEGSLDAVIGILGGLAGGLIYTLLLPSIGVALGPNLGTFSLFTVLGGTPAIFYPAIFYPVMIICGVAFIGIAFVLHLFSERTSTPPATIAMPVHC